MRHSPLVPLVAATIVLLAIAPLVRSDVEGSVPEATAFTTQRKLIRFSDGSLALAYVVQVNGTNRVQVARSPDGVAWTPLNPPSLSGPTADRPALAVDSRDTLHLAWTANETYGRQVFYASYSNQRWSPSERVSETNGYSGFPSIAVDARDRVHVAWYGFDGTYYQVYYRMRSLAGWGPQIAVTAQSVDATNPAIVIDAQGIVHVVWYHVSNRGTGLQVSYATVKGSTVTVGVISGGADAIDPTMVVERSGRVLVAWTMFGATTRIAYVIQEAGNWSSPVEVTPASMPAFHPSLALDGAGYLYLFYQGGDGKIYLARDVNATWEMPYAISGSGNNSYPSARWSYFPLRSPSGPSAVDVVWTEATLTGSAVRFASVPGSAPPAPATEPFRISDVWFFGVLAIAFAGVILLGRPRRTQ